MTNYKFKWVGLDGFVDANVIGLASIETVKKNGKPMKRARAFKRGDIVELTNDDVAKMLSCNGNWIPVQDNKPKTVPKIQKKEEDKKESDN